MIGPTQQVMALAGHANALTKLFVTLTAICMSQLAQCNSCLQVLVF